VTLSAQDAHALGRLGWPLSLVDAEDAVRAFQLGWNLGTELRVDGIVGPKTSAALAISLRRLDANQPTASPHFSFLEFACACGGWLPGCHRIWVRRELLDALETFRASFYPHGLTIRSGCRCVERNANVGGAKDSQHLYGSAADVDPVAPLAAVERLAVFSGLGFESSTRRVRHVDVRHVFADEGHDTTGGTPQAPTTWSYAG
jgi:hypothetical protein